MSLNITYSESMDRLVGVSDSSLLIVVAFE